MLRIDAFTFAWILNFFLSHPEDSLFSQFFLLSDEWIDLPRLYKHLSLNNREFCPSLRETHATIEGCAHKRKESVRRIDLQLFTYAHQEKPRSVTIPRLLRQSILFDLIDMLGYVAHPTDALNVLRLASVSICGD